MELKTPEEWADQFEITILDPDGWRSRQKMTEPKSFEEPISLEEFHTRLIVSTISPLMNFMKVTHELQGTQDKSKSDSIENLENNQEPLDPEFSKAIDENYWKLI